MPVLTNIFEYLNIFDPNIYSDIRLYQNFNTNIFGYSFVSKMFIRIYLDIRSCHFLDTNIFEYSFVSKSIPMSHSVRHSRGWFCRARQRFQVKVLSLGHLGAAYVCCDEKGRKGLFRGPIKPPAPIRAGCLPCAAI